MNRRRFFPFILVALFSTQTFSQQARPAIDILITDEVDSSAIAQIIEEGTQRSKAMEYLSYIADVYGPRLTGSPGFKRAADWTMNTLSAMGLANAHLEAWPFGRGWELKGYSANVIGKQAFPLHSYPMAWTPGVDATGDVILLDAKTDSALDTFKGKLKGKFVLLGGPRNIEVRFDPGATRMTEAQLLELANTDVARPRRPRRLDAASRQRRSTLEYRKVQMCEKEGALALLSIGGFDGGSIMVLSANVPQHPDSPFASRLRVWDPKAPRILPQIAVGVEHYNRMARALEKGETFKIEMDLQIEFTKPDSGYNVIAELPGTDLKDEVVMIGAHLDSWHGATGATDNGTGVAICMEAMRIMKSLNLKPRRTIRIALWGGEEQGEYGSKAYVKQHFGERATPRDGEPKFIYKPEAEKFSVYFNDDNGTGRFRGIYMEKNEAVRPIFRKWFAPFGRENSFTLTITGTTNTDHQAFNEIGLPAFQFIQDDIEYFTRTWHSTMDLYDRAIEDDLKQCSVIMAGFAYTAATRDEKMPRKK